MSAEWTLEEIEDLLADAIDDSMDIDWTSRIGARAIMRELAECGLHIALTPARRDLIESPPTAQAVLRLGRAVWDSRVLPAKADVATVLDASSDMLAALIGLRGILDTAESNASGNPEWEAVSKRVNAARAALAKAKGEAA